MLFPPPLQLRFHGNGIPSEHMDAAAEESQACVEQPSAQRRPQTQTAKTTKRKLNTSNSCQVLYIPETSLKQELTHSGQQPTVWIASTDQPSGL